MPNNLSPEEQAIVLHLLDLDNHQWRRIEASSNDLTDAKQSEFEHELKLSNLKFLLRHGLRQLALTRDADFIASTDDLHLAILMAEAAGLEKDEEAARDWATRANRLLHAMLAKDELPTNYPPKIIFSLVLQLVKVFKALQDHATVQSLRGILKPLLAPQDWDTSTSLSCLQETLELGFYEEAVGVLQSMEPPIPSIFGHPLRESCFRTLLNHNHAHFIWAILGMTRNAEERSTFTQDAIAAAVATGRYALAVKFAHQDRSNATSIDQSCIAQCLVQLDRISDWEQIWMLMCDQQRFEFDTASKLQYLAELTQHIAVHASNQLLEIADRKYAVAPELRDQAYAEEIRSLCFVIYAWVADEATVRTLLPNIQLHKDHIKSLLRAGIVREYDFLVEAVCSTFYPNLAASPLQQLQIEFERMRAGKVNQLEALYAAAKQHAFQSPANSDLRHLIFVVSNVMQDTARLISLHEEIPDGGRDDAFMNSIRLHAIAKRGDLATMLRWIERSQPNEEDYWNLCRYEELLDIHLRARFGNQVWPTVFDE